MHFQSRKNVETYTFAKVMPSLNACIAALLSLRNISSLLFPYLFQLHYGTFYMFHSIMEHINNKIINNNNK